MVTLQLVTEKLRQQTLVDSPVISGQSPAATAMMHAVDGHRVVPHGMQAAVTASPVVCTAAAAAIRMIGGASLAPHVPGMPTSSPTTTTGSGSGDNHHHYLSKTHLAFHQQKLAAFAEFRNGGSQAFQPTFATPAVIADDQPALSRKQSDGVEKLEVDCDERNSTVDHEQVQQLQQNIPSDEAALVVVPTQTPPPPPPPTKRHCRSLSNGSIAVEDTSLTLYWRNNNDPYDAFASNLLTSSQNAGPCSGHSGRSRRHFSGGDPRRPHHLLSHQQQPVRPKAIRPSPGHYSSSYDSLPKNTSSLVTACYGSADLLASLQSSSSSPPILSSSRPSSSTALDGSPSNSCMMSAVAVDDDQVFKIRSLSLSEEHISVRRRTATKAADKLLRAHSQPCVSGSCTGRKCGVKRRIDNDSSLQRPHINFWKMSQTAFVWPKMEATIESQDPNEEKQEEAVVDLPQPDIQPDIQPDLQPDIQPDLHPPGVDKDVPVSWNGGELDLNEIENN